MLYSPPVGVGSDRYPSIIYQEFPKNRETELTEAGQRLNIPNETQLRNIAKQKGIINTSATVIEKIVNGSKQIELVKANSPVKTRVVEARKTVEKFMSGTLNHGELEGYRASDGQHIGAFDPKTGNQLKPADPKRNIKKYL